jgi:hypothetical protein
MATSALVERFGPALVLVLVLVLVLDRASFVVARSS